MKTFRHRLHVDFLVIFFLLSVAHFSLLSRYQAGVLFHCLRKRVFTYLLSPFPILFVPYHARSDFFFICSIYAGTRCLRKSFTCGISHAEWTLSATKTRDQTVLNIQETTIKRRRQFLDLFTTFKLDSSRGAVL